MLDAIYLVAIVLPLVLTIAAAGLQVGRSIVTRRDGAAGDALDPPQRFQIRNM